MLDGSVLGLRDAITIEQPPDEHPDSQLPITHLSYQDKTFLVLPFCWEGGMTLEVIGFRAGHEHVRRMIELL